MEVVDRVRWEGSEAEVCVGTWGEALQQGIACSSVGAGKEAVANVCARLDSSHAYTAAAG